MNNTLSPLRLGLLLRKHLQENLRTYLISLLVFTALLAGIFAIMAYNSGYNGISMGQQSALYFMSLYVGGFIFTAATFKQYHQSRSDIAQFMLPASLLEKYLLHWLLTLLGFALCHFLVFHLAQYLFLKLLAMYTGISSPYFSIFNHHAGLSMTWFITFYLFLHAAVFLGAISIRKRTLISTAFLLLASIGLFIYLNYKLNHLYGDVFGPIPLAPLTIVTEEGYMRVNFQYAETIGQLMILLLCFLLWGTAFFKLKEKEV